MRKTIGVLSVLALSISFAAKAEDLFEAIEKAKQDGSAERARLLSFGSEKSSNELSDEELRSVNGNIVAQGVFTEEEERQIIEKFKNGDEAAASTLAYVNRVITDAQIGKITENNVNDYFFHYIQKLSAMRVPDSIIDHQIQTLLQAQARAERERKLDEARRAIFNQFLDSVGRLNDKIQGAPRGAEIVIDLGDLFNAFYSIPAIQTQLPGGMNMEIIFQK